jgi:hypothetical protein
MSGPRRDDLRAEARHDRVLPGRSGQRCRDPAGIAGAGLHGTAGWVYSDELARVAPAEAARRTGDALRSVLLAVNLR